MRAVGDDGLINAETFHSYTGKMLEPTLPPGDVVVMNNLLAQKGAAIRALIEARGVRLLYLRPCSPGLDPIELMIAKLKHLLRSAAARSIDRLWTAPGDCLRKSTPDKCDRYLQHCGYEHLL